MAKIIFFGTPDYVIPVPRALKKAGHEIVAVVTQPPKPVGRNKVITPSPVSSWAEKNKIKILTDNTPLRRSVFFKAEVGVVAAYGQIIPKVVLDIFPKGILNIHPSLLPKYRGASPIQAAIFYGDKKTGVTIIKMDEKVDHGPIIGQEKIVISDSDSFETLRMTAFELGSKMLVDVLSSYLRGKIKTVAQDHNKATYTWKISETKDKAYFNLAHPPSPEVLDRMSRAFYPWPTAWTIWSFGSAQDKNGKIVKFLPGGKIQMEGKKPVDFATFKRGYPDFPLLL